MAIRRLSLSWIREFLPLSRIFAPEMEWESSFVSPIVIFPWKACHQNPRNLPLGFFTPRINFRSFCSVPTLRDGNFDENATTNLLICPGCGVHMQDSDSKQPGFFIKPSPKKPDYKSPIHSTPITDEFKISSCLKRGLLSEPEASNPAAEVIEKPQVCARCHSLRYYGKVKDPTVENLLPDFDFNHTIGRKLSTAKGTRSIVLMVVDAADFDGSFPRKVAKLVSDTIEDNYQAWKEGKPGNVPRIVLVVTKIDLLPPSLSPDHFEQWVRHRAREGGAKKITSVHMVSSVRDWGLKNLMDDIVSLAGPRGNVWAIGAQNAGKSTLINALSKQVVGKVQHLTEAPVPGTTLGILRVEGVLPSHAKLFDTPGILHPYHISTRLTREEQKLLHIGKELKPRTYRIKVGHSVHIAGLMRLDIEDSTAESVYLTIWTSQSLPLHMGKTESASTMFETHFGCQLQPPMGEDRVKELGIWERREYRVNGNSWDCASTDVAAAGLGWISVGLKGEVILGVWTYDGVDVVLRDSLIPFRSSSFEVAGFTVSKLVAKADQKANKSLPKCKSTKKSRVLN